jgi:hypothetical protein
VVRTYGTDFRPLALEVLADAEAWCTISRGTRTFAQGKSLAHIRLLPSIFAELEQALVRTATKTDAA